MKLSHALCTVLLFNLGATAAFADAAPPPGPIAACKQDVHTLCSNVQPGGGRILACLKTHAEQVSADCKAAIKAARERREQQPAGTAPSAGAAPNN